MARFTFGPKMGGLNSRLVFIIVAVNRNFLSIVFSINYVAILNHPCTNESV